MATREEEEQLERERRERERNGEQGDAGGEREREDRTEDLTDELARKYDPDRMLKMFAKRAGGRGESLEHSVRAKYEKRFGVDLGHVRIFSGEFAEEFNRQRNAYAVTVGATGMIVMGNSPDRAAGSAAGEALLAHELTHVAQQARGLHRKATFEDSMPFAAEHEAEADLVEQTVMMENRGGSADTSAVDSHEAAILAKARLEMAERLKESIERIKTRVLELFGDTARNQMHRNGAARRA